MDGSGTARQLARAATAARITDVARRQLAEVGASGLSLRAVAREMGLASSALYRYFPHRDALLTALIIDAYDALGVAGERSYAAAARAGTDPGGQWLQVCRACWRWALAHPHEFALVYGSPVPGYAAPADTVGPATRVPRLLARVLRAAAAADVLMPPRQPVPKVPLVTAQVLAIAGPAPPQPFADLIERSLVLWVVLMGALSFELFGHLEGVVSHRGAWFDAAMAVAAEAPVRGEMDQPGAVGTGQHGRRGCRRAGQVKSVAVVFGKGRHFGRGSRQSRPRGQHGRTTRLVRRRRAAQPQCRGRHQRDRPPGCARQRRPGQGV